MSNTDPQIGFRENAVVRVGILLTLLMSFQATSLADDRAYLLNFDLNITLPDESTVYSIQLQGVRLSPAKPFTGNDLGKYDYFLTVSDVEDGKGRLTIEFYEYETRKKKSDVVSEIVSNVDFSLYSPAVFEATSDTFGVDLAFSVVER